MRDTDDNSSRSRLTIANVDSSVRILYNHLNQQCGAFAGRAKAGPKQHNVCGHSEGKPMAKIKEHSTKTHGTRETHDQNQTEKRTQTHGARRQHKGELRANPRQTQGQPKESHDEPKANPRQPKLASL